MAKEMVLYDKRYKDLDVNAYKRLVASTRDQLKAHIKSQIAAAQKEFELRKKRLLKARRFSGLAIEYGIGPVVEKTGRKSDEVGTFFLLAVTEHLRHVSRKPKFQLAARLLGVVRHQRAISQREATIRSKVLVNKLKKAHPRWKTHLRILEELYLESAKEPQIRVDSLPSLIMDLLRKGK